MKTIMTALGLLFLSQGLLRAQTDEDALRFSQLTFGGTGRFMGVAGAFGALGADLSTASMNPAGIGLYRGSEYSITPALTSIRMESSYEMTYREGSTLPFNISSGGFVFSGDLTRKNANSKWKRVNLALGTNRLNDYNAEIFYSGFNTANSMSDYYAEEASQNGGVHPDNITSAYPFGAGLFYQTYLINPLSSDIYSYESVIQGGDIQQSGYADQDGSTQEYFFTIATNYDDKLMLGATMGLPGIYYRSYSTFTETDEEDIHEDFQSFTKTDYLHTSGIGINGKFGMSYLITPYFRLGAAIHTPTLYAMHDEYNSIVVSSLDQSGSYRYDSPFGAYDYDLVTPWRAIASLAAVFGKSGFISVDYEAVEYNAMHYNFHRYSTPEEIAIENQLNLTIDQKYGWGHIVRVGGEYAYDIFRFRAGAAWSGSPFQSGIATDENDFSRMSYSGGFGVRGSHAFVDAAYVHTIADEYYQPYQLTDLSVPGVSQHRITGNYILTLGYRF